ncbi:hypothetical protein HBI12_055460 [Parastagonospora nodorum]|nr:hypothetical protein HBI12_055460 [Parastagonospora nodorum]
MRSHTATDAHFFGEEMDGVSPTLVDNRQKSRNRAVTAYTGTLLSSQTSRERSTSTLYSTIRNTRSLRPTATHTRAFIQLFLLRRTFLHHGGSKKKLPKLLHLRPGSPSWLILRHHSHLFS